MFWTLYFAKKNHTSNAFVQWRHYKGKGVIVLLIVFTCVGTESTNWNCHSRENMFFLDGLDGLII